MAEETAEQAPEASVEDRIGNLFGAEEPAIETEPEGEPEGEPQGEPETPTEESFEVEVDGAKYTLPKALEKAFMQERDYTQKSQAVADLRRTLEFDQQTQRVASLEGSFAREIAPQRQEISMLDAVIKQAQSQDWSQMPTDELIRKRLELDSLKDRKNTLEQEVQGKHAKWQQDTAQELQKLKDSALDVIKKRIPGYGEATQAEIRKYAMEDGYTEAELSSIFSPKHAVTLWKAAQYDKLKGQAKPTAPTGKPIKTTPSNPMPPAIKSKLAYQKGLSKVQKGSPEHKQLVANRIGQIFG